MEYQLDIYFSIQSSLISMGDEFFLQKGRTTHQATLEIHSSRSTIGNIGGKREIRSIRKDILLERNRISDKFVSFFSISTRSPSLFLYIFHYDRLPMKNSRLLLIREVIASFRDFIVQLLSSSFWKRTNENLNDTLFVAVYIISQ